MLCVRFPFLPFPPSFVVLILSSHISPSISTQNAKSSEIHKGLYIEKGAYSKNTFEGVYITATQHAVKTGVESLFRQADANTYIQTLP
jgi:hypothetical protein